MSLRTIARLARMDDAEAAWRVRTAARIAWDRLRTSIRQPRWDRRALARALSDAPSLESARRSVRSGRFLDAHRALADNINARPSRFVIGGAYRAELAAHVREVAPSAVDEARRRGDALVRGEHDLLGYKRLRFENDWHFDAVHGAHAPRRFWSAVPYLDPICGDHKVIWELNRHQHWLALGRAHWLTGDTRYREQCLAELAS